MFQLTVTPCLLQSLQKLLAENFFLVTVDRPSAIAHPKIKLITIPIV